MATTDFLLRPSVHTSASQAAVQNTAASQRATAPVPTQSFSSVYTQQQQRAEQAHQQQLQQAKQRQSAAAQAKQQQAARQSTAKNTPPPAHEKPVAANADRVKAKDTTAEATSNATNEGQTIANDGSTVEHTGNALPQEGEQGIVEGEEELLDPLFLFAMAATAAENTDSVEKTAVLGSMTGQAKAEVLLNGPRVNVQLSEQVIDADAELMAEELTEESPSNVLKTELNVSADKGTLLNSASGKVTELLVEKGTPDRNNTAALLDTAKAAPETLLNQKAVTPTETIRGDIQPRQDSILATQQLRQVPGAAVAMQQPGWSQQVTDKVMWMSSQNLKSAEIKLDPAELGRLEIKVSVGQEHTQVTFTSANASVRDSLEGQMHRLRELLAQQGMQDVDVNVSDQSQQQAEAHEQQAVGHRGGGSAAEDTEQTVHDVTPIREQHDGRLGLVDDYA